MSTVVEVWGYNLALLYTHVRICMSIHIHLHIFGMSTHMHMHIFDISIHMHIFRAMEE